jgi:hypothetical protein
MNAAPSNTAGPCASRLLCGSSAAGARSQSTHCPQLPRHVRLAVALLLHPTNDTNDAQSPSWRSSTSAGRKCSTSCTISKSSVAISSRPETCGSQPSTVPSVQRGRAPRQSGAIPPGVGRAVQARALASSCVLGVRRDSGGALGHRPVHCQWSRRLRALGEHVQTGARVQEIVALRVADLYLDPPPHVFSSGNDARNASAALVSVGRGLGCVARRTRRSDFVRPLVSARECRDGSGEHGRLRDRHSGGCDSFDLGLRLPPLGPVVLHPLRDSSASRG